MPIASVNPATGELLRTFFADDAATVDAKLASAAQGAHEWARTPISERATLLTRVADRLDARAEFLARLCTTEMGKPIQAARDEVAKCAAACRAYAQNAATFLAPEVVDGPLQSVHVSPLGVVLAVMPWNFPFWQVFRFAAPAIVAGNVALLKHASNVPQCALAIAAVFAEAGAPSGVFQTLLVEGAGVEALIADPRIAAVTLTGSEPAGRAVGAQAGHHLKKVVLELGGNDPFIVLASADVERAADVAVAARTVNSGQSCIAAKRFIVVDAVYDRFLTRFVAGMRALVVGDPMQPHTQIGPLATAAIRAEVAQQVEASVQAGARVLCGGIVPPGPGNYYPPTVLLDVPRACPAARDEIFGPVAAVFRVADAAAALELANDSRFGLGASVWTHDIREADAFAADLHVGMVFVNDLVASDVRFPFGGVRASGHGRELARHGLREFVNIKTVRMSRIAAV